MGAVFKRRGGDSLSMGRAFNFAGNELQFFFKKGMIFGTNGPRLDHNHCLGQSSIVLRSSGGDFTAEAPRSRLDRAAIAVRSGRDRGVLPLALRAVRSQNRWMVDRD